MIKVLHIHKIHDLPFEQYLKIKLPSFSSIKANGKIISPTNKMQLGSDVDCYLNTPKDFNGDLTIVKPIAVALKNRIGNLYNYLNKQISYICDLQFEDMILRCKFRPDWSLENQIVIDIKCSEDIDKTINFFGYPMQISGYCIPVKAKYGLIIAVNPKTKLVKLINITPKFDWWETNILKYGVPFNKHQELNDYEYRKLYLNEPIY